MMLKVLFFGICWVMTSVKIYMRLPGCSRPLGMESVVLDLLDMSVLLP